MSTTVRSAGATSTSARWEPESVRDALLAALTLATGAVDAMSWLALGKVFSAFMTGNLVFLGVVAGGAPGPDLVHVATSLVAFALGAGLGGWVLRPTRRQDHWWPFQVSLALGITCVLEVGALGPWKYADGHPSGNTIPVLIAMLAMAMGIQTVAIASLRVRGVFTTAATATLATLMGDAAGWPHLKGEAARLATVVCALVVGAGVGGLLVEEAPLWAPLFPAFVTVLVVVAGCLVFSGSPPRARPKHSRPGPSDMTFERKGDGAMGALTDNERTHSTRRWSA